jgi:hypothetical protein
MLLGPDGKPVMAGAVVGAPKLSDFEPVTKENIPALVAPLEEALSSGVHPGTPTEVPLGTLCLLASSLVYYMEKSTSTDPSGEE